MSSTEFGECIATDEPSINSATLTDERQISGCFLISVIKILTDIEIKVLDKGFNFAPVQRTRNEYELREDFGELCSRMRWELDFCNEVSENVSEIPEFRPKSSWLPPKGHTSLEIF